MLARQHQIQRTLSDPEIVDRDLIHFCGQARRVERDGLRYRVDVETQQGTQNMEQGAA